MRARTLIWTAGQFGQSSALTTQFKASSQIEKSQEKRGQPDSPGIGALVATVYTMVTTLMAVTFSAVLGDLWSCRLIFGSPRMLVTLHLSRFCIGGRALEHVHALHASLA